MTDTCFCTTVGTGKRPPGKSPLPVYGVTHAEPKTKAKVVRRAQRAPVRDGRGQSSSQSLAGSRQAPRLWFSRCPDSLSVPSEIRNHKRTHSHRHIQSQDRATSRGSEIAQDRRRVCRGPSARWRGLWPLAQDSRPQLSYLRRSVQESHHLQPLFNSEFSPSTLQK